jgi:tRNA(Ile)-lysidine synthase
MLLLAQWAKTQSCAAPVVLTVDHGLRADSQKDAQRVQKLAAAAGLDCHPLSWKGAKPSADIEAEARVARYSLMGRWCAEHQISALYVAHTIEDQAETFLLRLARGSGLDGLSAMQPAAALPVPQFAQVMLVRPLLDFTRAELRDYLRARSVEWRDDPMNTDTRFGRTRIRAAWPALEELGLTPQRLSDAAEHLSRARAALEEMTDGFLHRGARFGDSGAWLDPLRLRMLPREVGLRALASVLGKVSGAEYRPRFASLERLFDSIAEDRLGGGATLHGCVVAPAAASEQVFGSATIAIFPEPERKMKEPAAPSPRTGADGGN